MPSTRLRPLLTAVLSALLLAASPAHSDKPAGPGAAPKAEWRGVWITRFEWTGGTAEEMRARLRRMMATLARGNFNAVVFQVRGQGDVLYASPIEPWSDTIPAAIRGEDPVRLAIAEARRNGLEFHAWINLLTIWQHKGHAYPTDPKHPFWDWANPRDPRRALGVIHDSRKRPVFFGDSDYTWLTPGNPDVEAYLRRVVLDFVKRYDVDGLHWDDRTATPNGVSYDPVSVRRFRGRGNPDGIADMRAWQRDQLSRLLSNLYVAATAERPGLLVSASPFGIYDKNRIDGYGKYKDCVHDFGTDGERWLRDGIIDVLMPQVYWKEGPPGPSFSTIVKDWIHHNRSGRPIWPGSALGNYGGTQPLDTVQPGYVALTRRLKAGGNTFFSYSAATEEQWIAGGRKLYPTKAGVPELGFKTSPRTGQIMGWIVDGGGKPVTDAWIRLEGRGYTYLSGSDGFFAIPSVPAGEHTLRVVLPDGSKRTRKVGVARGATARVRINQGG